MDREKIEKVIKRRQLEDDFNAEFAYTLNERITRYLEIDSIKILAYTHFSSISSECTRLYRDGYFFACISLCQSVAEALVRHICERSKFGSAISKDFEDNIKLLRKRRIKPDCYELWQEIWKRRQDFHHLNANVPADRAQLQEMAKEKLSALADAESQVFAHDIIDGKLKPKYPKYWSTPKNGMLETFLRLDP